MSLYEDLELLTTAVEMGTLQQRHYDILIRVLEAQATVEIEDEIEEGYDNRATVRRWLRNQTRPTAVNLNPWQRKVGYL